MNTLLKKITPWRVVFAVVLIAGAWATWIRFSQGLGASTNLSDDFPWGLWVGFDVLCGVMLAAGGFILTATVHIFNIERFRPIIRPAVLTAFLGYSLVCVALLFDLGRSYRIWHPLIMWNPRSVMFEVGWCVTLYTTVLALEFSPIVLERFGLQKPLKVVKAISVPLVLAGVILSTLHQSSLGSLYLIVPGKLHPFWYTPLLPVFFFLSAIGIGLAMTIFESSLSARHFKRQLELPLLRDLGRILLVVLGVYTVLRIQDLNHRGALPLVLEGSYETRLLMMEMAIGLFIPIILLSQRRIRNTAGGLYISSVLVVLGFITNRLNVSITGMETASGVRYLPSWTEVAVTSSIVAGGFIIFGLAVKYLPVFPDEGAPALPRPAPTKPKAPSPSPSHGLGHARP
jgi:Ni/Fe-hydrogenase subunit HybB-like protein